MNLQLENLILKRQILELQSRLMQTEWEKLDAEIKRIEGEEVKEQK